MTTQFLLITFGTNTGGVNSAAVSDALNRLGAKAYPYQGMWFITGTNLSATDVFSRLKASLSGITPVIVGCQANNAVLPTEVSSLLGVQSQAA